MWRYLLDLFFPKVCPGCQELLDVSEYVFCTSCRHEIPLTNHHLEQQNEIYKKFYGRIEIEYASAFMLFQKKGIVQQIIHQLKYKNQQEIGTALGHWYSEILKDYIKNQEFDCIIPVPLHPKKHNQRGYNQVENFGKTLAHNLNISYDPTFLYRAVNTKTQSKKNRLGRTENIQDIFKTNLHSEYQNKHFVLVDDVITTGATLEACAKALQKIPGSKISIICMAIAE